MSQEFKIEIISPDKSIYSGKIEEAILPCFEGQVTILKDHIPLITFLRPGLMIIKIDNKKNTFFVEDGIVEFSNNQLLILTSTAKNLEELDKDSVNEMISESQKLFDKNEVNDKKKYLLSYKITTLKGIN